MGGGAEIEVADKADVARRLLALVQARLAHV